jgi:hypothetical protein
MGKYGTAAVKAVALIAEKNYEPEAAWCEMAKEMFPNSVESQKKPCPRNTFLGLCEEGLIKGVPSGNYTRSKSNKGYALAAVELLRKNPSLAENADVLWRETMKKTKNDESKTHNGQMDVVIALYNNKRLKELNGA